MRIQTSQVDTQVVIQ